MQRLYRKYGTHLILLDATHKTCKYALPLFFLVVQTNVNFQIVAILVLEDESAELLIRGLSYIKKWSPEVLPNYGMTDFDAAETLALEFLFPSIKLFLCDFHREQSWRRWTMKSENKCSHIYKDVIFRLRRVANAFTPSECEQAITDLKAWDHFRLIENYFTNTWLPVLKKWSKAYRPDDLFNCNTNNGTEGLNKLVKYKYLKQFKKNSLTNLLRVLIETFIPERLELYVELNTLYTPGSRKFDETIPKYMISRPGPLVKDMREKNDKKVTSFMVSSVVEILVQTRVFQRAFSVQSVHPQSNEVNSYIVRFGNVEIICSCK